MRYRMVSTCDVTSVSAYYSNQNIKEFQAEDLSLYASFCRDHLEWTLQLFTLHTYIFIHIGVDYFNRPIENVVFIMQ
jgi:hypothetical protein